MGGLFASILSASNTLHVVQQGLNVVQANVANVSTPGYAKQNQTFVAKTLDIQGGLPGGVSLGPLVNSRNQYAEAMVQQQTTGVAEANQRASDLSAIEPVFQFTDGAGISGAIDSFFNAASQLTVNPNDQPTRQSLLDSAKQVAGAFQQTSSTLSDARANADRDISNVVDSINATVSTIRHLNVEIQKNGDVQNDAGFDSQMQNALQTLSQYTSFTAIKADDGTMTIMLGGQSLALVGGHQYNISSTADGTGATIYDSRGNSLTPIMNTGQLGALVNFRNNTLPRYQDSLNHLAGTFADQVNTTLQNGVDQNGTTPVQQMFTYDSGLGEAITLQVNPLLTSDIAAASANAPGGNGNAVALAALGNSKVVDGYTFSGYYGTVVARVGRDSSQAQTDVSTRTALLSQAKSYRSQISDVSLDEEAAKLIQFQKSYEANARMVTVLTQMTDTVLSLLTPTS